MVSRQSLLLVLCFWLRLCVFVSTQHSSALQHSQQQRDNAQSPCYFLGKAQRCQPVFVNAAYSRRVETTNTCGLNRTVRFCSLSQSQACQFCVMGSENRKYSAQYLTDFDNADNETWWQSETMLEDIQYPNQVNLTMHLGKSFDITYIRLKFKSPRPESFAIFKKTTQDGPWLPFQYYSSSCRDTYGLPNLAYLPESREDRAVCTSEFTDIVPLTGGSVAFATLEGRAGGRQFDYNDKLQRWVTATDVRISLQRLNTFGDEVFRDPSILQTYYYAISDLAIGGACKCNGHASSCVADASGMLQCQCQHNTDGQDCERCLPFYNDQPWRRATPLGAHECRACDCNGFSETCFFDDDLYIDTGHGGHCTNCTFNRDGVNCEYCLDNHYDRGDGFCEPCHCHTVGSRSLQCNTQGVCTCKPGVTGDKCDQCLPDFHHFSEQGCSPCGCVTAGSVDSPPQCNSSSGQCRCKRHVEGLTCDRCKPGYFALNDQNRLGCTPCFCYGHSSECRSASGYAQVVITTEFLRGNEGWSAGKYYAAGHPMLYNSTSHSISTESVDNEPVYFILPDRYLGDQRASYSRQLAFTLSINQAGPEASVQDIVLQGAGMEIAQPIFGQGNPLPTNEAQEYVFTLHEDSEYGWIPRLRARDFIAILSNVTAIKIRATYTRMGSGSLENFALVSARRGQTGILADWVETCSCPTGYVGQFCESCQPGFHHDPVNGTAFARCVACNCNGHADICHAETGKCICQHNTSGDNCERCASGYYGNAMVGRDSDCQPCPCPQGGACIELSPDEIRCLECPRGYTGGLCEVCDNGWFGRPPTVPCRPCDCNNNVDDSVVGYCNSTSGYCVKCIHNTAGQYCQHCLPGYFGDALALPKGNCRSCGCNPVGTVWKESDLTPSSSLWTAPITEHTADAASDSDNANVTYLCDQLSGQCLCRRHVEGIKCERCKDGFWNIHSGQGCEACDCNPVGSHNSSCHVDSGKCHCRPGIIGSKCDKCEINMYGFSVNGCSACECDPVGSINLQCANDGQCLCRENVEGIRCDRCKENKFDRQAGCRDCPPCYLLVKSSVNSHRDVLQQLSGMLADLATSAGSLGNTDEAFRQQMANVTAKVRQLLQDSIEAGATNSPSPHKQMLDMQERLREVRSDLAAIWRYLPEARRYASLAAGDITTADQLIQRINSAAQQADRRLQTEGRKLLSAASRRSDLVSFQSSQLSDIARQSRKLADDHQLQVKQLEQQANELVFNATSVYRNAYGIIEQQRSFRDAMDQMVADLALLEQLASDTTSLSQLADEQSSSLYDLALNAYTDAKSTFTNSSLDTLTGGVNKLRAMAENLQVQVLTADDAAFLDQLSMDHTVVSELYSNASMVLQLSSRLVEQVNNARIQAEKAVSDGDSTLEEAQRTLSTLRQFDEQIQESRQRAVVSLGRSQELERILTNSERLQAEASTRLSDAEHNAADSLTVAQQAMELSTQANATATLINTELVSAREKSTDRIQRQLNQQNSQLQDFHSQLDDLESQWRRGTSETADVLHTADQARAAAAEVIDLLTSRVNDLRRLQTTLTASGDRLRPQLVSEIKARLTATQRLLGEDQLSQRIKHLQKFRVHQITEMHDRRTQLHDLREEVKSIGEIADSLPSGCYFNSRLEP